VVPAQQNSGFGLQSPEGKNILGKPAKDRIMQYVYIFVWLFNVIPFPCLRSIMYFIGILCIICKNEDLCY